MINLGTVLADLVEAAVPGVVWKAIPAKWRAEGRERIVDWGPYKVISTNHDLVRAVRIAWINGALRILDAAQDTARIVEWRYEADTVDAFVTQARKKLRRIRLAAFDRRDAPGFTPIDHHARDVLAGTPEFAHPSGRQDVDQQVTDGFSAALTEIVGAVPELVSRIARDGLKEFDNHPRRTFGELVFSDFAELLKNPSHYPEARPAFQIYMAGATKKLGDRLLAEIGKVQQDAKTALGALELLGADKQQAWLDHFEAIRTV